MTGPPSKAWFGLFVPTGVTPKQIIDKYAAEVASIVKDPGFAAKNLKALQPYLR